MHSTLLLVAPHLRIGKGEPLPGAGGNVRRMTAYLTRRI